MTVSSDRMRVHEITMLKAGYVSAAQAIKLCGIAHVSTVHRWGNKGHVRHKRVGAGRHAPWFFDVRSLLALFKGLPIALEIERFIDRSVASGKMAPAKVAQKPVAGVQGAQGTALVVGVGLGLSEAPKGP